MNKYEIMFIVKSENDEKTIKDTVSAFEKVLTDMKAKIDENILRHIVIREEE